MAALRRSIPLRTGWKYRSRNPSTHSSTNSWQPSRTLPTEIHLDLLANGVISNPFLGKNEEAVQWVGEQTWQYETYFEVPQDAFESLYGHIELVFEGLDTYAAVELNGREILRSENMFVSHRVQVAEDMLVKDNGIFGQQRLRITFDNAERLGAEEAANYPNHQWFTFNSGTSRLATRKAQYHYVSRTYFRRFP